MKKTYLLEGLCCANCAAKIERGVADIDGVTDASVNFLTTKLTFEGEDSKIDDIVKKAKKIVKKIEPDVEIKEL
jgi:copper chaperone CopZ